MSKRTKRVNLKKLYRTVYEKRSVTKPELAQELGLSLTAVSDYVNQLEASGYVLSTDKGSSSGGRKPWLYEVNPAFRYIIGIDMRASHFYVFLSDMIGQLLHNEFVSVEKAYDSYVEAMADTVKRILTDKQLPREKILAVGISISGVTDFANKVVDLSNELSWAKKPLGHALEALLGIPVFVENDARVYARNEIDSGDPNNVVTVLYLNRGVGLALVIGSSVLQGYTNRAGDSQFFGKDIDKIYHVIRTCALFQEIFELPYYYQGTDPAYIAELNRRFMQHLKDNQQWQADMDVFSTEVARMMIAMANVVNPKRILLTGNVFDYYDYIYPQVRNKILQLPVTYTPEVKRNSPQDNPLENGIVRLIMEKFFQLDQFSI
jgi:predicted NBD/HSP70 family sugar kinase/biotin operon repressor